MRCGKPSIDRRCSSCQIQSAFIRRAVIARMPAPGVWLILLIAVFAFAPLAPIKAAVPGITVSVQKIETGDLAATDIHGEWSTSSGLVLEAGTIQTGVWPEPLQRGRLSCGSVATTGALCGNGAWEVHVPSLRNDEEMTRVSGATDGLDLLPDGLGLKSSVSIGELSTDITLQQSGLSIDLEFRWDDQSVSALQAFVMAPSALGWATDGTVNGRAAVELEPDQDPQIFFELSVSKLSFDSPDGQYAGAELDVESRGTIEPADKIRGRFEGEIRSGELLIDDFYRNFSDAGIRLAAEYGVNGESLVVDSFEVTDDSALTLSGSAVASLAEDPALESFSISGMELKFPLAYGRYIEPVAAIFTLDGLEVTGAVNWSGEWLGGQFQQGDLLVSDLTVVDLQQGRFAITGLDVHMRPGDYDFDSTVGWRGMLLGPINLGSADLNVDSAPGRFAIIEPLVLNVLGGELQFDRLAVELPTSIDQIEQELDLALQAEIRAMDMERLTTAMGWPAFSGQISGKVPAVSYDDGVLDVGGEIEFDVFDGSIAVSGLSVERPFGVLPSLAADIDIYDLDLQQVTQTFSFGQIGGRLDGYVHDLRMLDWEPVAFDAWLGTPERQDRSTDISRQAVNRLTTLGGGAATTALTNPFMKLFDSFSYRRLGMGCRLSNYICDMRGISEDDVSVLIMEGAGIPKIMIRAFNRRLDFPQLVAGLTAMAGDESVSIGD